MQILKTGNVSGEFSLVSDHNNEVNRKFPVTVKISKEGIEYMNLTKKRTNELRVLEIFKCRIVFQLTLIFFKIIQTFHFHVLFAIHVFSIFG